MVISRVRYVKALTAGAVSWNTDDDLRGILKHISVNPSSTTTIYDIKLTDDAGTVIYKQKGRKGDFADDTGLMVYGKYTIDIENASISTNSFTTTLIWDSDF